MKSPPIVIDTRIKFLDDWRIAALARVRAIIKAAALICRDPPHPPSVEARSTDEHPCDGAPPRPHL